MNIVKTSLVLAAMAAAIPFAARAADDRDSEPVIVVAHVDFIPDFLGQGLPAIQKFVTDSKNDPGVKSFVLITWSLTTNHFQLIEVYNSLRAFNNHVEAAHTISFRTTIQPYIGAPYDERRYVTSDQYDR